ncbi:hypothetical protein CDAR_217891 [Caerostris darwini]|uniref:Uncharacterized protein n=1 Tax=Caerostris darwini TaxID=1538125 RepID=A0AAV4SA06_9ARAC|nr:hypothetical protein CDAR_217891 [Caerostris darwini]
MGAILSQIRLGRIKIEARSTAILFSNHDMQMIAISSQNRLGRMKTLTHSTASWVGLIKVLIPTTTRMFSNYATQIVIPSRKSRLRRIKIITRSNSQNFFQLLYSNGHHFQAMPTWLHKNYNPLRSQIVFQTHCTNDQLLQ